MGLVEVGGLVFSGWRFWDGGFGMEVEVAIYLFIYQTLT